MVLVITNHKIEPNLSVQFKVERKSTHYLIVNRFSGNSWSFRLSVINSQKNFWEENNIELYRSVRYYKVELKNCQ
ncbi:hypothetical protein ALTER154_50194 [Alteromonas sp. 154]|nr:hypothetical protein ALTER154_50194 [Alteromonas sp. 154]